MNVIVGEEETLQKYLLHKGAVGSDWVEITVWTPQSSPLELWVGPMPAQCGYWTLGKRYKGCEGVSTIYWILISYLNISFSQDRSD